MTQQQSVVVAHHHSDVILRQAWVDDKLSDTAESSTDGSTAKPLNQQIPQNRTKTPPRLFLSSALFIVS